MWLHGKRSVAERLKANPQTIMRIFLSEGTDWPEGEKLAALKRVSLRKIHPKQFFKLARDTQAQGVIAEIEKFQYSNFYELISQEEKKKPVLLFLDRITDPRNLGAIIRSSACFGGFSIVLSKNRTAEINETVLKVACGAENYIPVTRVTNLSQAVLEAKKQGYWIYATVVGKGYSLRDTKLNFPLGLIFGSEGEGIKQSLIKNADFKLSLPMPGAHLSFNVAVAASLFCYEIACQRTEH
jgi:23S rRNA (guanosine2251-2'-O)-methyltransferase